MLEIHSSQYDSDNRMQQEKNMPEVAILLCSYNGQAHLKEQLDSFTQQTHLHWRLWVSDDGSTDDTLSIVNAYQQSMGQQKVSLVKGPGKRVCHSNGPGKGYVFNFLSITCNQAISADYYAYSDQDDIWEKDKLERALKSLSKIPSNIPALYCSRTMLVDDENREIGLSTLFNKPPSFANALVQCIAGGNTMVFNHAACQLVREVDSDISIVAQDWWLYMIVSGCGGIVFYDDYHSIRYRQHTGNLVGRNNNWQARFARIRLLFAGKYKWWIDHNIQALEKLSHRLTPENHQLLKNFSKARKSHLIPRLIGLKRVGIYRQTRLGNLGLWVAAIFNKL